MYPSTTGASGQPTVPDVNPDLNAGVIQPPTEPLIRPNEPSITVAQPQGLSVATAPTYATTKEINQQGGTGILGDVNKVKAIGSGIASLGAGLIRSVPYISDLTNKTINTVLNTNLPADAHNINIPIANQLEDYAKKVDTEIDEEHPKETLDYLKEGEYSKAFDKIGNNVAKMLPVTLSLMVGNAAGASATALGIGATPVFGAQEKQSLKENNPEMTDEQMNNVSLISGALEGATEAMFGNVKLGSFYKNLLAEKGKEEANKIVGDGVKKVLLKGLGKYGANIGEEAASEGANQYLDNLNHIYVGGDKNVKPFDGVMESVLTAVGSAGALGSPVLPQTALQAARTRKQAEEGRKHADNQIALKETITSPLTSSETKEAAKSALETSYKEEDKLRDKILQEHEQLPADKKSAVNTHLYDEHKALSASQDPNLTEEQRDAFKSDAEFHAKAVEEIYKENEKLLEEKAKNTEKEKKTFEKNELPTEGYNPQEYSSEHEALLKELQDELLTNKPTEDATKERKITESNQLEHQNGNESGPTTETSNRNSDEQSREKQQQEEVNHLIVAHAPTETTEANITSSVSKEPLSEKGEAIAEKVGEQAKDEGVQTIITDTETKRNQQTAEKAAEISGAKVEEVKDLHTWDKGQFAGIDSKDWKKAEKYFLEHPDQTEYEGKKINESFNEFKYRYLEAKEKAQADATGKTLFVASSTAIRLEQALEAANGIWGKKAIEHFLDNSIEHEGDIEANPEHQGTESTTEHTDKLDKDLEAFKQIKPDNLVKKYTAVNSRIDQMVTDKKIGKREANAYKKLFNDVYDQKIKNIKEGVTQVGEDIKKVILGQYKGKVFSSLLPVTPKMVEDLVDLAVKLTHIGIDAKLSTEEAVQKALEKIKKSSLYQKLVATKSFNEKEFEKEVMKKLSEAKEIEQPEAPKENNRQQTTKSENKKVKKSTRSLSNNLYESENLSDKVKEIVRKNGLDRDIYTHDEAKTKARELINEVGTNGALAIAKDKNSDIAGNVRTFILAHVLNDFHEAEMKAKTPLEKDALASLQADLALDIEDLTIEMEKQSTEAGRLIGAIGEFYKMSPLGIKKKISKEIARFNTGKKKKMKSTAKKFKEAVESLEKIDKEYKDKNISEPKTTEAPKSQEKIKEIRTRRKELFTKLRGTFNNLGFAATPENIAKLQHEQLKIVSDIAKSYFEEGIVRAKDLFKQLNKDLKAETGYVLSEEDKQHILNQDIDGKKLSELIGEKEAPILEKEKKEKQLKVLKKALGEKKVTKSRERTQKEYEKLLDLYNNGATTSEFENAFYEKFGLTNIDNQEVKDKLEHFSKKIHSAPEGVLRNNETVKYLDWLADYRKRSYITDALMSSWYASILSSYETHARNMQYNGVTSLITMPALLAQKAITKGNFGDVSKYYQEFFNSLGESMKEAKAMVKTGQLSRFEDIAPSNVLERSKWTKWMTYPGRFLRAEDALATLPLYTMKQREIFSRVVDAKAKEEGVKLSTEKRNKAIDDLMGYSEERREYADNQASQDIERVYGENWRDNPEAVTNQKIRKDELIDKSRPLEVREEARAWAKKALLTNKPEGMYGVFSDGIGFMLNHIPPLRAIMPFINVPLNIMNQIVERSPLGFIKPIRNQIWFDREIAGKNYGRELTPEERKELFLKATNYSVLLGLVTLGAAMNGAFDDDDDKAGFIVTGKEGDYFRNQAIQKGGGLEPYTVYIGGKDGVKFNYQNTPLASIFSPVGFYRDYLKYEDTGGQKNLEDGIVHSTFGFLNQIIDAASMKGMKEIFKYMDADERKRMADDGYKKEVAKKLNTLVPYSGLVKATTKDVKGLVGANEKAAQDFTDYLVSGLPFDYYQNDKIDILGRPIKSQFDIPMFPYSKKNFSNDGAPVDKYYKLFKDHNYDPSTKFIKSKNAYTDKRGEFEMSKQELYELNKTRGEIAMQILTQSRKGKGTIEDQLEAMSDEKFSDTMDKVFEKSKQMAMIKMFVFDGNMPNKKLKNIYNRYKKTIEKDKSKEKPIEVL